MRPHVNLTVTVKLASHKLIWLAMPLPPGALLALSPPPAVLQHAAEEEVPYEDPDGEEEALDELCRLGWGLRSCRRPDHMACMRQLAASQHAAGAVMMRCVCTAVWLDFCCIETS